MPSHFGHLLLYAMAVIVVSRMSPFNTILGTRPTGPIL